MLHLYTWCDIHGKMGCLCPCVYFNLVFDLVCMVCECVCDGVTVCVSVYVCDHMHVCVCVLHYRSRDKDQEGIVTTIPIVQGLRQ